MYRKRHPQTTLFEAGNLVPEAKATRLRGSWAHVFRTQALPLIDEDLFAHLYCQDNGRPNRPVQTVLGVLILKEMFDLTDEEALERLEFDLLWQYGLSLTPEEAHLPQKTLHNFRSRLVDHEGGWLAFASVTDGVVGVLGTKVNRQRLDSTQVLSNIAVRTRLGLFCETIRVFLSQLQQEHPRLYGRVPVTVAGRYLKDDGSASGYQDAASADGPRRLSVCARDLYRLCHLFEGTAAQGLEAYGLLTRLLEEQCEVVDDKQPPTKDDDDRGDGAVPVVLKEPKQVSPTSLQSPHDPDATYSKRKGKGYEVQMAETCHEDNVTEVITHVAVSQVCGQDAQAAMPALEDLAQRGQQPEELVADTAYGSADNALEAQRMGTELVSPVAGSAPLPEDETEPALTAADFVVDPALADPAVCPGGHFTLDQRAHETKTNSVELRFEAQTCQTCPLYASCPAERTADGDAYVVSVDLVAANLGQRRRAQAQGTFQPRYRIRAGIEATASEMKRRHGLGELRVRGRPRVVLAVYLKAAACNVKRLLRTLIPKPAAGAPAMA